jgi:hypothetical protein
MMPKRFEKTPFVTSFSIVILQEHHQIHEKVVELDGIANAIVGGDNNAAKNAQDFLEVSAHSSIFSSSYSLLISFLEIY